MAIIYKGDCSWRLVNIDTSGAARSLPTKIQRWEGRGDQFATFMATKPIGLIVDGGYIIDRHTSNLEPKSRADLVIAYQPDFQTSTAAPGVSIKTASKTALVTSSTIIPKPTDPPDLADEQIVAELQVTYYSPETRWTYYTSQIPQAPRHNTVQSGTIRILRSVITARAYGLERVYAGALAPAALVSALTMVPVDQVTGHDADPILGTPWYRCTDVVSRELA